jgi:lipoprotein-releasing system ATP-binding protein
MTALLRLEGVSHGFPGTGPLFEPVTRQVRPGEVLGLCGPSGCGKSTLLSILAGWVTPSTGRVVATGVARIGWVFQNPHGVPGRTAIDHVTLPFLARGLSRAEAEDRALAVLSLFDLVPLAGRPFRALSGGEAQRLMLARAVAAQPDLLLVDEPTAQLDTRTARTVNRTLTNLAQSGSIVVIATHDPETRAACTQVVDLSDVDAGGAAA